MHIAILQFELLIDSSQSLKDKRRVVRSIKDKLHKHHQVSVAEISSLDVWNRADMGLVMCNRSAIYLKGVMDAIVEKLRQHPEARLGECVMDIISASDLTADAVAEDGSPLWTEDDKRESTDSEDGPDSDPTGDDQ